MTWFPCEAIGPLLDAHHYLGALRRGEAWFDKYGIVVLSSPTSRRIPTRWAELSRWCILSTEKNAGSRQWAAFCKAVRERRPDLTTIVSYSDPSVGHTGALYRACNWRWAPTWHRLRPPPSGLGSWKFGERQAVKDRWVFPLRPDVDRAEILRVKDASLLRKYPTARYVEPNGVPYALLHALTQRSASDTPAP